MRPRSLSALSVAALLILGACSAAPDPGDTAPGVGGSEPTPQPTMGIGPTALPPGDPTPTDVEQPDDETAAAEPTAEPDDGAATVGVAGAWTGTITASTGTQDFRLNLREIGAEISGTARWEHGRIQMGLRGTREGDAVTLIHTPGTGDLTTIYEATIDGDTMTGTVTDTFGDQPAPGGPSSFEVAREE